MENPSFFWNIDWSNSIINNFSIPEGYRKYYPKYVKSIKKKNKPNNSILASAKHKLVAKTNTTSKSNSKKRKVGRPKIQPKKFRKVLDQ